MNTSHAGALRAPWLRSTRKTIKQVGVGLLVLAAVYFLPFAVAAAVGVGLLDFLRNKPRTLDSLQRYFRGNGVFTWLLSPFNLLLDLLALPYRNKGVYQLSDLPQPYQEEITALMQTAHHSDLVGKLQSKVDRVKRGMVFFKWYGKNVDSGFDVPAFQRDFRYIRTIGVSVFNKKQSTSKHFGPLRATLRVLYNVNPISSRNVFITVGDHTNHWCDNPLFIFDDTLEHQSCNQSDEVRYCMFVDIVRPSLVPGLMRAIVACIRILSARFNSAFYKHWTFIK